MLMLKITVLSHMLIANKMLAHNEVGDIESSNKLIEKSIKLKIRKLLKSQKLSKLRKSKSKKSAKLKKPSKSTNSFKFIKRPNRTF